MLTATARTARAPSSRLVIWMLFIVSILNYVDRQIPFILLESIKADLGLSDTQMGLLTGLTFSFIYSVFAIPIAILADRWSPKWTLSIGLLLWCGLTTLAGFVQNFAQLVGTRMGVAAGEAASLPASHALISSLLPAEKRGRAISMVSLGVPVGAMIGMGLGGWLNDVANWRVAMIVVGFPGVIFALLCAFVIPDVRAAAPARTGSLLAGLRFLVSLRSMRHLVAGLAIHAIGLVSVFAFTATFMIRSHGMSTAEAGLTLGLINGISGILGLLTAGWVTDRISTQNPGQVLLLPGGTFLVMIPLIIGGFLIETTWLAMILLAFLNFCAVFYLPPAFATAQRLAPPEARAQASALIVVGIGIVGGSLGPLGVGLISDLLSPAYGTHALRYSLCLTVVPTLWGAIHVLLASRALRADLSASGEAS